MKTEINERAESEQYVFDAGPDLLKASILANANELFIAGYLAGLAPYVPLLDELRGIGFKVNSPSDLVRAGAVAIPTLPTLMNWFSKCHDPVVGLGVDILRVLEQPWAYDHTFDFLVRTFRTLGFERSDSKREAQWYIGDPIVTMAKDSDFEVVLALTGEPRYGMGRAQLIHGVGRFRSRGAILIPVLLEALDASDLEVMSAVHALGELRALEARGAISVLQGSAHEQVRYEVTKALKKLETAERRAQKSRSA